MRIVILLCVLTAFLGNAVGPFLGAYDRVSVYGAGWLCATDDDNSTDSPNKPVHCPLCFIDLKSAIHALPYQRTNPISRIASYILLPNTRIWSNSFVFTGSSSRSPPSFSFI